MNLPVGAISKTWDSNSLNKSTKSSEDGYEEIIKCDEIDYQSTIKDEIDIKFKDILTLYYDDKIQLAYKVCIIHI